MPRYALGDVEPDLHPAVSVHPDAVAIGNVTIGVEASIGPTAVLRSDGGRVEVGARSSVPDGVLGIPARVRDGYEAPEGAFGYAVPSSVERGKRFRAELRRLED